MPSDVPPLGRWFGIDRAKRATAASKATDFRAEAPIDEWGYKFHMNDINATIGMHALIGFTPTPTHPSALHTRARPYLLSRH